MTIEDGNREDPRGRRRRRRNRENPEAASPAASEETAPGEVADATEADEGPTAGAEGQSVNGAREATEQTTAGNGAPDGTPDGTPDGAPADRPEPGLAGDGGQHGDGAQQAGRTEQSTGSIVAARGIEDEDEIEDEEELPEAEEEGHEDEEEEELTLRERIEDGVYDTREWVAESRRNALIAVGVLLLSLLILYIGGRFVVGLFAAPEPDPNPPAAAARDEAQGNPSGTPGDALNLAPAENAGEVQVEIKDNGRVRVTHALGAQQREWTGEIRRAASGPDGEQGGAGNSATLELTNPTTEASFATVLSEDGARSWMGRILDTSREGTTLEATQTSDPGAAALDGRVPFLRGTYVIKGSEGAGLSASGRYSDTLVDESTVERLYSEDYITADGEARRREWRTEYNIRGDAALLPFVVAYEPPDPEAPDPQTSDPKPDGQNGGEA